MVQSHHHSTVYMCEPPVLTIVQEALANMCIRYVFQIHDVRLAVHTLVTQRNEPGSRRDCADIELSKITISSCKVVVDLSHLEGSIAELHNDGLWCSIPTAHMWDNRGSRSCCSCRTSITSFSKILFHISCKITQKLIAFL